MRRKKLDYRTPRGWITSALRRLFMISKERKMSSKIANGECEMCSVKTKEGVQHGEISRNIHHRKGVNWDRIIQVIHEELLCDVSDLMCLCRKCHFEIHGKVYKPYARGVPNHLGDEPTDYKVTKNDNSN